MSQYQELKDELLLIIENKMKENSSIISQSNKLIEDNKRIMDCFLEEKYQIDKIENLEKLANKSNDSLISHEIRIGNIQDEIRSIKTKYDKIVLDNLNVPGIIGLSCPFRNLSYYIRSNVTEMAKLKSESESVKKDSKDFKIKLDGASKNIISLIDGGVLRCNQYADSRINDFHAVLENKLKEMSDKFMEIRMKNIQFQNKLEQQINKIKTDFEEKLENQKEELIQLINNKIEYIKLDITSLEKATNFEENEEIKKYLNNLLEKEMETLKQMFQNSKNDNSHKYNSFQGENKLNKNKKKNEMSFEKIKNNNFNNNIKKSISIKVDENVKKVVNNVNSRRNSVDLSLIKRQRDKNALYPPKSKFNTNNTNKLNTSSSKSSLSNESLNNSKEIKNSVERIDKKHETNKSISTNKKFHTKTNLININDKINLIEDISDNPSENIKNINNQLPIILNIKDVKNNTLNKEYIRKNTKNENNNISQRDLIKVKNNHNLTATVNENSQLSSSVSNSSKQENTNDENNLIINTNTIFVNRKNDIKNNILEKKPFLNTINRLEKKSPHLLQDNLKNLKAELSDNNNESKISSKINYNKSQGSYKDEIINDLFSKYDKSTIPINLNLIKNKANLDLYNYSISPPSNRFLLNAKINEIIEPPEKELFFEKEKIPEKKSKLFDSKRNILKPSLNMQLFYGNFNEKRKEKNNNKINSFSNSEQKININIKNNINNNNYNNKKIGTSLGKSIYNDIIKREELFTMTSYKK